MIGIVTPKAGTKLSMISFTPQISLGLGQRTLRTKCTFSTSKCAKCTTVAGEMCPRKPCESNIFLMHLESKAVQVAPGIPTQTSSRNPERPAEPLPKSSPSTSPQDPPKWAPHQIHGSPAQSDHPRPDRASGEIYNIDIQISISFYIFRHRYEGFCFQEILCQSAVHLNIQSKIKSNNFVTSPHLQLKVIQVWLQ